MRLFLTRRWILFAVAVALLAGLAWRLGEWQFHRLAAREADNAVISRNLERPPAPAESVLAVGRAPSAEDRWRRVTATGAYDAAGTVVIRYQTRDGASGVDLVTPLRTDAGPALLVDRGWVATDNRGIDGLGDLPAPPAGEVTVVGWVREDAEGDSAVVTDASARSVSSAEIAPLVTGPVYGGFVDAASESPTPAQPPARSELPDLGEGPHLFYGIQWWFFGVLAIFGFFYLAYDEVRQRRRRAAQQAAGEPVTDPAASRRRPAASRR